jgi:hypothetical protein
MKPGIGSEWSVRAKKPTAKHCRLPKDGDGLVSNIGALCSVMKELFRERDYTKVGYFQSVLEAEGIATIVKNKHLTMSGLSEIPIPEFFPALCVINDEDYGRAIDVIRRQIEDNAKGADLEIACPACGETNPGNFDLCWSCGAEIATGGLPGSDISPA